MMKRVLRPGIAVKWLIMFALLALPATHLLAQVQGEGYHHHPSPEQTLPEKAPGEPAAPPIRPEEIQQLLRKARLLMSLGKTDTAISLYYEILQAEPGNLIVLDDLLIFFFESKNWAMAISTLEEVARRQPDNTLVREALSLIHRYYDLYHLALPLDLELFRLAPEKQEYLAPLVETLNYYGLTAEVLPFLERLHALDPSNVEYIAQLALNYYAQNKLKSSLGYYRKLAERTPDDPAIPLKIARLMLETWDLANAVPMYEAALQRMPDDTLLQEEMNYVYAEAARDYFARDRLSRAKQYFLRSGEGDYPYPFADEYVRETEAEMSWKTLYDFRLERYRFAGKTTLASHTGGVELPIFTAINRCHLLAQRQTVTDRFYTFHIREFHLAANLELHRRIHGTLSLGYSDPENAVNARGEMVYNTLWNIALNPANTIELGVSRKRVLHSSGAVDKNIFYTEYSALYGHFFLNNTVWSALEYKYGSFTGGNTTHLATFDLAYTPLKRLRIPDDLESKPPLHEEVKTSLDVGASLEYVTFQSRNDLYFTLHDQPFGFARGQYMYSPVKGLYLAVDGAIGKSLEKSDTLKTAAVTLKYVRPFRLHLEVQYMLTEIFFEYEGVAETNLEQIVQVRSVWYF